MNARDKIDYVVMKENNKLINTAFNRAFAKISKLTFDDMIAPDLINDIIKTEFDNIVIPISDNLYGGVKEQFQAAIRKAQMDLRRSDRTYRYNFDLTDKTMLDLLDNGNSLFMSQLYNSTIEGKVIDSMKKMVSEGKTKSEVTDEIANMLNLTGKKAINSIARNVINTNTLTRSIATANALETAGALKYKYIVILDNVTSPICRALYGKSGEVKTVLQTRDAILNAPRTDYNNYINEINKVSPMIAYDSEKDVFYKEQDNKNYFKQTWSEKDILNIPGIAIPPLHQNCRTEIMISS